MKKYIRAVGFITCVLLLGGRSSAQVESYLDDGGITDFKPNGVYVDVSRLYMPVLTFGYSRTFFQHLYLSGGFNLSFNRSNYRLTMYEKEMMSKIVANTKNTNSHLAYFLEAGYLYKSPKRFQKWNRAIVFYHHLYFDKIEKRFLGFQKTFWSWVFVGRLAFAIDIQAGVQFVNVHDISILDQKKYGREFINPYVFVPLRIAYKF